jgi:multidrug efflux pump subunit AcrA (membrane-fusion protein)
MNRLIYVLTPFLLLLLAACSLQEAPAPELIVPVSARLDIARADRGVVADIVRKPGIVRLRSEGLYFEHASEAFGAFYVNHGDAVQSGQLLARLDTEALEEEIIRQENNLVRLREENALRREIRQLEIDEMLYNYNRIFRADDSDGFDFHRVNALLTAIETAQLALTHERQRHDLAQRQAAERLDNYRRRLTNARLYAPYDGIITYMQPVTAGDGISAFAPILYIADFASLHIEVYDFTARDFPDPPSMSPTPWIPIPVIQAKRIRAYSPHGDFDLTYIGLSPAERTGHGMPLPPVYMEIAGQSSPPLGAMLGVHFYLQWAEDALRIPSNALFHEPAIGFFVYRAVNGQLIQTPLEVSIRAESFTEVLGGLAEGDEVFVRP